MYTYGENLKETNQQLHHITPIPIPTDIPIQNIVVSPTPVITGILNNPNTPNFIFVSILLILLGIVLAGFIFRRKIHIWFISLNTFQKFVWSTYTVIILLSIIFRILGGDLWGAFFPRICYMDDFTAALPWDCITQHSINIVILLLIPVLLLHYMWRLKK